MIVPGDFITIVGPARGARTMRSALAFRRPYASAVWFDAEFKHGEWSDRGHWCEVPFTMIVIAILPDYGKACVLLPFGGTGWCSISSMVGWSEGSSTTRELLCMYKTSQVVKVRP